MSKVMVSFPEEFLAEVDRIAREEHRSRSELLREALRLYVNMRRGHARPSDLPKVRQAVEMQDMLSRSAPGTGEDSAVDVRRWRESRCRRVTWCWIPLWSSSGIGRERAWRRPH